MSSEAKHYPKFSSSEGGGPSREDGVEMNKGQLMLVKIGEEEEGQEPPWTRLGLEVGRGGGKLTRPLVFTEAQLCELHRQLVVLSYIRARLPVPLGVLVPTRDNDHSLQPGLCRPFQTFVGFGPLGFDCCNLMEPEPGRCRRTDGKKWRCKNDVVPNTKYCERHIHRGCTRSRKLVEGSVPNPTTSPSTTSQPLQRLSSYETPVLPQPLPLSNPSKNSSGVSCNLTSSSSLVGDVAPEAPGVLSKTVHTKVTRGVITAASKDVRAYSSGPTSHEKIDTTVGLGIEFAHNVVAATSIGPKRESAMENIKVTPAAIAAIAACSNCIDQENTIVTGSSKVPSNSMVSTPSNLIGRKITTTDVDVASSSCAAKVEKSDSGDRISHHTNNSEAVGQYSLTKRKAQIRDINKLKAITSQGFNFSPKSVLQVANDHHPHPHPLSRSSPCFYTSNSDSQPWRCRRTDGRKWRCRRDVIPNEKYCAMHMHRGAKKQRYSSQTVDLRSSKNFKTTHHHLNLSLPSKEKYNTSLNTDLSICTLEISRPIEGDELSTASGSTDATISDDNTSL